MNSATALPSNFRNVILCEDIRNEVGNKKSLMGVIGGDLLVPSFPTSIHVAIFIEYILQPEDDGHVMVEFRMADGDTEVMRGNLNLEAAVGAAVAMIIPTGLLRVDKETTLTVRMGINGRPVQTILSRKVLPAPSSYPTA